MKLTYLRGACVVLEMQDCRILCDPWLCDGPYYGAWAHYPPFTEEEWQSDALKDIDFIYVSHLHPDHFDQPTMRRLRAMWRKLPPVLIYDYPPALKILRTEIQKLGFETIEVAHGGSWRWGRTEMRIFSADNCDPAACGAFYGCSMPGVINTQIDSMAVIRDQKNCVVNVNDCPFGLSKELAEQIGKFFDVDLAMVAYAGAGPFPQCFKMEEWNKFKLAKANNARFINDVAGFAEALGAKVVFPFAGDYQLCGKLSPLNEFRGVPTIRQVHEDLRERGLETLYLEPGTTSDPYLCDLPNPQHELNRLAYVQETLLPRMLDYEGDDAVDDVEYGWPAAFERFAEKREQYGLKCSTDVYVQHGDSYFHIPPNGGWDQVESIDRTRRFVSISCDDRLLVKLLRGPRWGHWNNAQVGSHIMFERQPVNLYEPGLYHLLSYLHA